MAVRVFNIKFKDNFELLGPNANMQSPVDNRPLSCTIFAKK